MNITPRIIGFAIHRIFVNEQVGTGCSLPLRVLIEGWADSGLRRSDLGPGLETLRGSGHLHVEQTSEGPVVRLLNAQFALVRDKQDREGLELLQRLRELRKRPGSCAAEMLERQKSQTAQQIADRRRRSTLKASAG